MGKIWKDYNPIRRVLWISPSRNPKTPIPAIVDGQDGEMILTSWSLQVCIEDAGT